MKRAPEPRELMDDADQARVYAEADFDETHAGIVAWFDRLFPDVELSGSIIDLGCGPGDIAFRFARRFPSCRVVGVDGARAMLALARQRLEKKPELEGRVRFVHAPLPSAALPGEPFDAVVSNSLLHHLDDPGVLWQTVRDVARSGTLVFVADLMRPNDRAEAVRLVDRYAVDEPDLLRRDFLNSLCAAFTPDEVRRQLERTGLARLSVRVISDRHLLVHGRF